MLSPLYSFLYYALLIIIFNYIERTINIIIFYGSADPIPVPLKGKCKMFVLVKLSNVEHAKLVPVY